MQDQTLHLKEKGISATFLGSAQTDKDADEVAFSAENGSSIVFITPEWLFGNEGKNLQLVKTAYDEKRIGLIAIDECHLIYDWQDFRPAYKQCETLSKYFLKSHSCVYLLQSHPKLKVH